jgi:predicted transcriptional regulator
VHEIPSIQGDLQRQLMGALWRLSSGTVEDVRNELPVRYRGAYTTVQTVLNRLASRGLLSRARRGNAIVYQPVVSEAEYLRRTIERTLSGASSAARQVALGQLIGNLESDELADIQRLARGIKRPTEGDG